MLILVIRTKMSLSPNIVPCFDKKYDQIVYYDLTENCDQNVCHDFTEDSDWIKVDEYDALPDVIVVQSSGTLVKSALSGIVSFASNHVLRANDGFSVTVAKVANTVTQIALPSSTTVNSVELDNRGG